ncbi:ABC transporter related protein [Cupriavidus necator]|uniref:ABC transporter ATP-binding protein n=1 Tax=Cupriavidus necator TaxID=106590 RepID=UPI003F7320E5
MSDLLLSVNNVGKKYAKSLHQSLSYGLTDIIRESVGRRRGEELRVGEFWAIRDVSFDLRRGECLALLGGNGAGKSTLLKMISGMLALDSGKIDRFGRMEKMIELSSGFSPSLTGRENVRLKAKIMGATGRGLTNKLEEIVEFSELEEFIDTPVQYYSSGMKARLGFALSVAMEPDILLIDEVLAVGDLGFRMKCYARVDEMRSRSAVILVTHSMNHVARMATSGLVLRKGRVELSGSVQECIAKYQDVVGFRRPVKEMTFHPERVEFDVIGESRLLESEADIAYGCAVRIEGVNKSDRDLTISVFLHDAGGTALVEWNSKRGAHTISSGENFGVELDQLKLCPGHYMFRLVGFDCDGAQQFLSEPFRFRVLGEYLGNTSMQPAGLWDSPGKSIVGCARLVNL